jgi:hypothetical protein
MEADSKRYFYTPTVMKNISPCIRIASGEVFGPIAPVITKMYRYYNQYAINGQSYFFRIPLLLLGAIFLY